MNTSKAFADFSDLGAVQRRQSADRADVPSHRKTSIDLLWELSASPAPFQRQIEILEAPAHRLDKALDV